MANGTLFVEILKMSFLMLPYKGKKIKVYIYKGKEIFHSKIHLIQY